jgi:hypothetical protein
VSHVELDGIRHPTVKQHMEASEVLLMVRTAKERVSPYRPGSTH